MTAATILIVDDEIQNRKLLEVLLRHEGYLTLSASSGEEALAVVSLCTPDLILLDIMMPGMDGYQVATRLKANPATLHIPIIMVTALIDRSARLAGLNAGAEEFLTKPIDQVELHLRVRNLLRLKEFSDFLQNHSRILEQQVQEQVLARTTDLQRFRTAMDATADAIFLVDRSSMRFVEVNATACHMFGYTRDELLKIGPTRLDATTREQLARAYDAIIAAHSTIELTEIQIRHKDGSRLMVEMHRHAQRAGADWIVVCVLRDITERNLADDRLLESEARFKIMFNSAPLGIAMINSHTGQLCLMNPMFAKIAGRTVEEMAQVDWMSMTHPDDVQKDIDNMALMNAGKISGFQMEKRYVQRCGTPVWINMTIAPVDAEDKAHPRHLCMIEDITERRQIEENLRVSDFALKSVSQGVFITDPDGGILSSNDAFLSITGYSKTELLGHDCRLLQGSLTDPRTVAAIRQAISDVADFSGEILNYRKDGSAFWNELTISPVRDKQGLFTNFIGFSRDITRRKLAEGELRIAATAFESQEGIMVTDANSVILRVNRAFTKITGYTAEDVMGKSPRILNSGQHGADFYAAMWETIKNTGVWEGEVLNQRKNGELYPEYLIITAVKGADGAVTNYVATLVDIALRKVADAEIQRLAFYDHLTNLPNRRLLLDRLNHALATSARSGRLGAVLYLDLDQFKTLNDTRGHEMGDLLLQQVAGRLTACVREGDTVARLGGDEFVVVLEELSEQALDAAARAEVIGNKILAALNQPYQLGTHEYHCSVSIGVTLFSDHEQTQEELLSHADIAMYQAKKAGRNTMRFFDPKMQDTINARAALQDELHKALEKQQFHLYYQIQVDSVGRPLGAEALIRWIHPERGLISPFHFIPLAEETGLILPIGQWVLETACAQLKVWQQDELTHDLTLSVNVSARQFRQPDFVAQVQAAVLHHAINPLRLKLELTEGVLLERIDDTIGTMHALKDMGIRFSLDDFGTGYSSLQYLKRLPLEQLKIDQSFVRDLVTDSCDQAIVRTIIAMADSLKLGVIAEGVETEEQRQMLLNKGCTHYQGYLFGRPVPIEQFEVFLKQSRLGLMPPKISHGEINKFIETNIPVEVD